MDAMIYQFPLSMLATLSVVFNVLRMLNSVSSRYFYLSEIIFSYNDTFYTYRAKHWESVWFGCIFREVLQRKGWTVPRSHLVVKKITATVATIIRRLYSPLTILGWNHSTTADFNSIPFSPWKGANLQINSFLDIKLSHDLNHWFVSMLLKLLYMIVFLLVFGGCFIIPFHDSSSWLKNYFMISPSASFNVKIYFTLTLLFHFHYYHKKGFT